MQSSDNQTLNQLKFNDLNNNPQNNCLQINQDLNYSFPASTMNSTFASNTTSKTSSILNTSLPNLSLSLPKLSKSNSQRTSIISSKDYLTRELSDVEIHRRLKNLVSIINNQNFDLDRKENNLRCNNCDEGNLNSPNDCSSNNEKQNLKFKKSINSIQSAQITNKVQIKLPSLNEIDETKCQIMKKSTNSNANSSFQTNSSNAKKDQSYNLRNSSSFMHLNNLVHKDELTNCSNDKQTSNVQSINLVMSKNEFKNCDDANFDDASFQNGEDRLNSILKSKSFSITANDTTKHFETRSKLNELRINQNKPQSSIKLLQSPIIGNLNTSLLSLASDIDSLDESKHQSRDYRTHDEFVYAMKEDLSHWLSDIYGINLNAQNFIDQIGTGVIICKYVLFFFIL